MSRQRMPTKQHSLCVRSTAFGIVQRIAGCVRSQIAPPIVSRLLLSAICFALSVAPARAGFCLAADSLSTQHLNGSLEIAGFSTYSLLTPTEHSFDGVGQNLNGSGASTPAATERHSPKSPVSPARQPLLPGTLILGGASADFSGRSLSGSSRSPSGGGGSAASGIVAKPSEMPIPLRGYWQRGRELVFIPDAPPFDVFRPPPVATLPS